MKLFDRLPTPLLTLAAASSVFLMGIDLLVLDPLPFLDEAFLLFMTASSTSELMSRFRSSPRLASPGKDGQKLTRLELRRREEAVKTLEVRTSSLIARARLLESQGYSGALFESLTKLPERVAELRLESAEHEAFFTRRDNDLWQIQRKIRELGRTISGLPAGKEGGKLASLREQLVALQQHEILVSKRQRSLEQVKSTQLELSLQVDALEADLSNLADDGAVQGGSLAAQRANLDPSIEAVVKNLEQFAVAEAEIESVLAEPSEASPSARLQPTF
jgi:hypothetical protein